MANGNQTLARFMSFLWNSSMWACSLLPKKRKRILVSKVDRHCVPSPAQNPFKCIPQSRGIFHKVSPPLDQHLNMPITLSRYFLVRNQRHHEARLSFRLHIPLKKLSKYISKLCWQQGPSISRFQSLRYPVKHFTAKIQGCGELGGGG